MNKVLAVWGLLVLIGFLATQYTIFSLYDTTSLAAIWIVLIILGVAYCKLTCSCKKGRFGKKKTCSCCCCLSGVWAVAIAEGIILTVAIWVNFIQISAFYLLSVWLILAGAAALIEGMRKSKPVISMLGVFWLASAVLFPFVNNFQYSAFTLGALIFGAAMILAGIVEKE